MWFADPSARLNLGTPDGVVPAIRWEGYLRNGSGYGEEGRGYALGLARRGHEVTVVTAGDDPGFLATLPADDAQLLARLCARQPRHDDLVVQNVVGTNVHRRPVGGYHVARTMFETDGVPAQWLPLLATMDEIWVPTPFNVTTFRAAGVRTPVHVVPAGVDAERYRPGLEPLALPRTAGTVFLGVAANSWDHRHGWDVLLSGWADAFGPDDDVLLVLKTAPTPGQQEQARQATEAWIDQALAQVGRRREDCAPIVLVTDHIPSADMPRLYAAASAVVTPLRGTAFGRPLLEAMSCALPVVATRWSAIPDFLDDANGYPIEVDELVTVGTDNPVSLYHGQRWARPCTRSLVDHLRSIADDPAAAAAVGRRARADVVARWTWDAALDVVEERVADIRSRLQRPAAAPGAVALRWEGDQYANHSLSVVNREITSRLVGRDDLDVELHSREVDPDPDLVAAAPAAMVRSTGHVGGAPQVTVRHQWPPDWAPPQDGAWVAVQPWEFGALPASWLEGLKDVDEVWCYTTWVRDCYELSGVPADRLRVVPLGVDVDLFTPEGPRHPLRTRKGTRLLFCGGPITRKGIDVLVRSYCATFTAEDDVCLVIKAHGTRTSYRGSPLLDEVRRIAAVPGAPEVEIIDEDLDPAQLAALYRACDALVHPYRGEGFALPVAEAMSSGLPVVVTAGGATRDFCDDTTAYLVPAELVPVAAGDVGPSSREYFWAEPDGTALGRLLREVVTSPAERAQKGRAGRERIARDFTWDRAAALAAERVAALAGTVPLRQRPVAALETASQETLLHHAAWDRLAEDQVLTAYLQGRAAGDDVCLVLPVPPQREHVDAAVTALESRFTDLGLDAAEVAQILLVPCEHEDQESLRSLVRWSSDRIKPKALTRLLQGSAPAR